MQHSREQVRIWLTRHLEGTLPVGDGKMLMQEIVEVSDPEYWTGLLTEIMGPDIPQKNKLDMSPVLTKVLDDIRQTPTSELQTNNPLASRLERRHFLQTAWLKYAAAIVLFLGAGAYVWNLQKEKPVLAHSKDIPVIQEVMPGSNKAILQLSNGQQVVLDSSANHTITEGNLAIKNANGQLVYTHSDRVVLNTMSTPKGGQYKLTLADGTKVWLNAASSITFPTDFKNGSREVSMEGEAYFEVANSSRLPFVVKTKKEVITVLGTTFNINAYADETLSKISLLEGKIKVNDQLLTPGQASIGGKVISTNMEQDLAWKNGLFNFQGRKFPEVIRQLARWYNLDVVYQGAVPDIEFRGKMSRDVKLSSVLSGLQGMDVHFQLEGNKLIIYP